MGILNLLNALINLAIICLIVFLLFKMAKKIMVFITNNSSVSKRKTAELKKGDGMDIKQMEVIIYCPYCKEELNVKNGELYCKDGESYFSKHIEKVFNEKIGNSKKTKTLISTSGNSKEGRFFCVNCGNKMMKIESMHEICLCCGFEITKGMYYEIIELNPHKK
ncbi:hypothetical protein [Gottfriedia acidiceleris]|uniref:hypothetical protein n=1 Tax=Gottfriedia acidiceleris TaxID=371036 RepID=UPI00101CC636|nr:hypothetical protein [Gottfriedia acidiceleris]